MFSRRITMKDSTIAKARSSEEFEWQKRFRLPERFFSQHIPGYFKARGPFIKIGLSLRTRRTKLHPDMPPGIAYYPIGVDHAYTGNSVSISAPFEMDADRSHIVDTANSAFNAWLLRIASEMTLELLRTDWVHRFGMGTYRAVGEIDRSALPAYSEAVEDGLKNEACWPSRVTAKGTKATTQFAPIQDLILISEPTLDHFLDTDRYFHSDIINTSALYQLAAKYGAKQFTINSLVRLRCAGEKSDALQSTCKEGEACYYYTDFPDAWSDLSKQQRCAIALDDCRKRLSKENSRDLAVSPTTLSARNTLDAPNNLWFVPEKIQDACPVPEDSRLHPKLSDTKVLTSLCKPFDVATWINDVIGRLLEGEAHDGERLSLYRYIISVNGKVPKRVLNTVRESPVLRDQDGHWVSPRSITAPGTTGIRRFRPALHLPHRDYAKDAVLARTLRFKTKITGDDIVRYAQIVSNRPEMASQFERILGRSPRLLTARTIKRLATIAFIPTNDGELQSPSNVYLDTPKNRACIGPQGPYPTGNAMRLFSKLGCRAQPHQEEILQYLETLRQNDQPPPRPDILYPELVAALKRETDPAICEDDEILWTESGYTTPAATILGGKWDKVFLSGVSIIKTSSRPLARAYRQLGVREEPEEHHWKYFFVSQGERYREVSSPLSARQRRALRTAYIICKDMPSLPTDIPWLLDEHGHLHTASDAAAGRFVIEDDLALGAEIRISGLSISFADDSNPSVISAFRKQGVNLLTSIRVRSKDRVGKLRSKPTWFQEQEYVKKLARTDFRSALNALAARDLMANPDALRRIQATVDRLASLERIVFVQDIFVDYRVNNMTVSVSAKHAWTAETINLTWVRSRSGLEGMLAALIAWECLPHTPGVMGRFSDSIFRLISCRTGEDLREYLEQRGIKWRPESDNEEAALGDYISDVDEAIRASVQSRGNLSESPSVSSPRPMETTNLTERSAFDATERASLPPIDTVNARIVQPRSNWSYSPKASGGSGGGGGGWSSGNRNGERDRIIGCRGEEIIFELEKARVRKAGYRQDRVVWVSQANPTSDFDIESVDEDGKKLFIEVKATSGSDGRFHWSLPEFHRALHEGGRYILYRVYLVDSASPIVCAFRNPIALISSGRLHLDVESFRAEVQPHNHGSG